LFSPKYPSRQQKKVVCAVCLLLLAANKAV
jgi:hypothetical protein